MNTKSENYHHGDLRQSLITQASHTIENNGIASLSMRKLGELLGVSRSALYHHFKGKQDLLSAIAEQGFTEWKAVVESIFHKNDCTDNEKLRLYVHQYLNFAQQHKATYELMFGKEIWIKGIQSKSLKDIAYQCFDYHVNLIKKWQTQQVISSEHDALRVAQVTWSTLHGLAKLFNDGIYSDAKNIEPICETAVLLFQGSMKPNL